MDHDPPVLAWSDALQRFSRWRQGDHVALVGPTGCGKTTLVLALIELRKWACIVATKPRDRTLGGLGRRGWTIVNRWGKQSSLDQRVILWTKIRDLRAGGARAGEVIHEALQAIYVAGSWSVVLDDLQALLLLAPKLRIDVQTLLLNARSGDISLVCCSQRPRWVPVEVWAEATWVVIWPTSDEDDLRSLPGMGGLNGKEIRRIVAGLDRHQCLVINTHDRSMFITQVR